MSLENIKDNQNKPVYTTEALQTLVDNMGIGPLSEEVKVSENVSVPNSAMLNSRIASNPSLMPGAKVEAGETTEMKWRTPLPKIEPQDPRTLTPFNTHFDSEKIVEESLKNGEAQEASVAFAGIRRILLKRKIERLQEKIVTKEHHRKLGERVLRGQHDYVSIKDDRSKDGKRLMKLQKLNRKSSLLDIEIDHVGHSAGAVKSARRIQGHLISKQSKVDEKFDKLSGGDPETLIDKRNKAAVKLAFLIKGQSEKATGETTPSVADNQSSPKPETIAPSRNPEENKDATFSDDKNAELSQAKQRIRDWHAQKTNFPKGKL